MLLFRLYTDSRRLDEAPTRRDLVELDKRLVRFVGRHDRARALLAEHAVVQYFAHFGYEARRAGAALDAKKIDVVAISGKEVILTRIEAGTV